MLESAGTALALSEAILSLSAFLICGGLVMPNEFKIQFFIFAAFFVALGNPAKALACGGMTFPGSLLCSPVGTLVTLGTVSRPASPTAYPPNFIKNNGGGYTAVWPTQTLSPGYSTSYLPNYSSPSYSYPSYSYGYPNYSFPSYSYSSSCPNLGGSLLMPSLGGGMGSCGSSGFSPYLGAVS